MDISLGANLTIGPNFLCAACIVRLFVAMKRRQVIHADEMGAVKCALGMRAKGDTNAGYKMYLYMRADSAPRMQAICMCEIAIWTDPDSVILTSVRASRLNLGLGRSVPIVGKPDGTGRSQLAVIEIYLKIECTVVSKEESREEKEEGLIHR